MSDRSWSLIVSAVALWLGICGPAIAASKPNGSLVTVTPIEVRASAIRTFHKDGGKRIKIGKLEWIGGLVLSSPASVFGGYSGIDVSADGRELLAVSDAGTWLGARLSYDRAGRPTGLEAARVGPLLGSGGRALKRGRDRDAEAIRLISGSFERGRALVAFERNQRIGTFVVRKGVLAEPLSYFRPPVRLPSNKGLESVAMMRGGRYKGAVVAFAERAKDSRGHHRGWLWQRGRPQPLALTDDGEFDITDLASLADGSLVVLERRFRWSEGVQFRLRLVPKGRIKVGAVLSGITLIKADMRYEIDNMEGLALHRDAKGRTIVTLISDDNFNKLLQRTLLLQFVLPSDATKLAAR